MINDKTHNLNEPLKKANTRKRLRRIKKADKKAGKKIGKNADKNTKDKAVNSSKEPGKIKKIIKKLKLKTVGKFILTTLKILIILFVALGCAAAGALGGAMIGFIQTAEPLTKEQLVIKNETSYIYDSEGNTIAMLTGRENQNRDTVFYKDTPEYLRKAFIAIEDERFESHIGIDIKRIASAIVDMFRTGGEGHGGSTITQQVVRAITGRTERTIKRKVQEWYLAIKLERMMEKWQILELYMNLIYMGNGCYGVQSASKLYFGKDVKDLSLAECALLAGITNSPSNYDPFNTYNEHGRENAIKRQRIILKKMLDLGFIDQNEYEQAINEELKFANKSDYIEEITVQSYFVDYVINEVAEDLMEEKGMSRQMALTTIYSNGVLIYTTMDPNIQEAMDEVFLDDNYFHKNEKVNQHPQAGMVIIDPNTGHILAMRGGYGEKTASNTLNRATQIERPAGSSFKPIAVFAPAVDRRLITAATVFDDAPVYFLGLDKGRYPLNYSRTYEGLMTTRYAIKRSINVPAARVYMEYLKNPNITLEYLRRAGIDRNQKNLSIALGGLEQGVSPLLMAAAYVPFANRGIYYDPVSYTKVTDKDGNIILEKKPAYNTVYDEATAFVMTDMLKDVCRPSRRPNEAGGTAARLGTIRNAKNQIIPTAGKTGTTDDDKDRWFIGYSKYYVGAVWYGYDYPAPIEGVPNNENPAAMIWNAVMTKIHSDKEPLDWTPPSGVVKKTICVYSGKIATEACTRDPRGSAAFEEYFIKGTEPADDDYCDVHIVAKVCKDSTDIWGRNLLAGSNCPESSIVEKVLIARPVPFRPQKPGDPYPQDWIYEYPAGEYCTLHGGKPLSTTNTSSNVNKTGSNTNVNADTATTGTGTAHTDTSTGTGAATGTPTGTGTTDTATNTGTTTNINIIDDFPFD
ncbi:MAG TPA: PBP1A family penicillin-binding protein [Clostridiaceae bacterium]|nr:PBP1A family penicillin-binding protein [Clostridiaceae bacterium]